MKAKTGTHRLGVIGSVAALVAAIGAPLALARPAAAAAVQCGGQNATIVGTAGADTLNGTAGTDVISGLGGNDRINGLGGNDVICGDVGNDIIDAGDDQDRVWGGADNDTITGGAGVDEVSYGKSPNAVVVDIRNQTASGEGSDQVREIENVTGSQSHDRIYGDAQANVLIGLGGNDLLVGAGGPDVLADGGTDPNATNDFVGGAGADIYYGGVANDIADFYDISGSTGSLGVIVDLANGTANQDGADLLSGMDSVKGTAARDVIKGNGGNNTLQGGGGNDLISGRGGDDTLLGEAGDDILDGGIGNDRASFATSGVSVVANLTTGISTGEGTDNINVIEGLLGGPGNDTLTGNAAANTIEGGTGNDTLDGLGGIDWVVFDSATTSVRADLKAGTATSTNSGNDTLARFENLRGGAAYDFLRGDDGNNTLAAGNDDQLEGLGGDDVFESLLPPGYVNAILSYESAPGGVTVNIDAGAATGAAGKDTIGFVPITILGSNHGDRISCSTDPKARSCRVAGRNGSDTITGTVADDVLTGGLGNDSLDGKAGADLANFDLNVPVNVNLSTGKATGQGNDTVIDFSRVVGSNGNDTIVGLGDSACIIWGIGGDDNISSVGNGCRLFGGNGNDTITGSPGNDVIDPDDNGAGNDTVGAGAGNDRIVGDTGDDHIDGGPGTDLLAYDEYNSTPVQADFAAGVVTGLGNDTAANVEDFTGGAGNDAIRGNDVRNVINGGEGNDTIFGGAGDDQLTGGGGNDWMDGNAGSDLLIPQSGDDMMYGEGETDTVSWADSGAPVTVYLSSGYALGEGFDHFNGVENLIGSVWNDTLIGDAGPNVIDGRLGSDACDGAGGGDTLLNCP